MPMKLFPYPTSTHSASSEKKAAQPQSLKTLTPEPKYKLTLFTPSAPVPRPRVEKWTVQTAQGPQYGAPTSARDKEIIIPLQHPITDRIPVFRRAKTLDPVREQRHWQDAASTQMKDNGAQGGYGEWGQQRQSEIREERQMVRQVTEGFRFAPAPSFDRSLPGHKVSILTVIMK